jgi:hypothetical protein
MADLRITDLRFTAAPSWWRAKDLLGWASGVVDDRFGVGGLGVRRVRDGEYVLSFPGEEGENGNAHHDRDLLDEDARQSIGTQVIGDLRERGLIP